MVVSDPSSGRVWISFAKLPLLTCFFSLVDVVVRVKLLKCCSALVGWQPGSLSSSFHSSSSWQPVLFVPSSPCIHHSLAIRSFHQWFYRARSVRYPFHRQSSAVRPSVVGWSSLVKRASSTRFSQKRDNAHKVAGRFTSRRCDSWLQLRFRCRFLFFCILSFILQ